MEELATVATDFNVVRARRVGKRVDLDVAGAIHSSFHPRFVMTGYSWDALTAGCLLCPRLPRNVLVLGLGGGTSTRQLRALLPEARLVGVDIDEAVVRLARAYMGLDAQALEVHIADGYEFLARNDERFDAIVDDLFVSGADDVARPRIPTVATLELCKRRLAPDGLLVANFMIGEGDQLVMRRAARAAFVRAFDRVRLLVPPRGFNEIIVGGPSLPRSALARFAPRLIEPADRERLRQIDVRLVRRPRRATGA